jgi:signal transduction histidine kinase
MGEKLISGAADDIKAIILQATNKVKPLLLDIVNLRKSSSNITNFRKLFDDLLSLFDQSVSIANGILENSSLVEDSCNVALETLNDMLTFDKIDENMLVVEISDVDPLQLIHDSVKPFQINAKDAGVKLTIHNRTNIPEETNAGFIIKADRFKINQVLRNLLSNGLKFTSANGRVDVVLEIKSMEESQLDTIGDFTNVVRVSVADTGVGISKENQAKLFGQYVQFDAAALQCGKGSGLGLWISKSIQCIFYISIN